MHGDWTDSLLGKRRGLEFSAEHSLPSVNTLPYMVIGQTDSLFRKEAGLRVQRGTLPSTSQHSTVHGDWTDRQLVRRGRGLELNAEHSIPSVNTVPYMVIGQAAYGKRAGLRP